MKKLIFVLGLCFIAAGEAKAVERQWVTGDNVDTNKVSVTSTTAATLNGYSTSRFSLTCVNSDSTNQVWIGTSTAISAAGAASFPLTAKQSIQMLNHTALFAIADTGISSVNVYCLKEY